MKNSKAIWTVKTECGPIREKNEDAIYPDTSGSSSLPIKAGIFDGMGGHKKGEVASLIASEVMNGSLTDISDYVNLANKNILDYQNKHSEATGMGTTMTIVEIDQEKVLHLAHVGDSRCYVLNNRNLIQLTKDENVPGYQNVLTQALGSKEKLKIQTKDFQLTSGDVVFLCTDGVYNEIGDEYLKNKLLSSLRIPKAFLGFEEQIGSKATLAAEDVRFARTIERIQRIVVSELTKIAVVHLYAQGFRDQELVNFDLGLTNPSTIYEQEKLELWSQKASLADSMVRDGLMSTEWIYKNVFGFTDDEMKENDDQIIFD